MSKWEDFEIECTKYLNERYGKYATFTHQGGSDSTTPDIFVNTNSGSKFYIEAKHSPAQCGQFVLIPDIATQSFTYSTLNSNNINIYSQKIIQHMNTQFEEFKEAGTTGKDIIMSNGEDVFSFWIIENYQAKNTRYFITNNYTIFPIENFQEYFNVTAKYRVKRSGSSDVGKSNCSFILNYINSHDYAVQSTRIAGSKLFVVSNRQLHNKRFILSGYEYMFSLRDSEYEVRKLSNTFNANVIFSIESKTSKLGLSPEEFVKAL